MFKTLTRYLENYAGFSEGNITQTVVVRGSCVSPQQFAVLLTSASIVLSFGILFPELMAHIDETTETTGEYITLHQKPIRG